MPHKLKLETFICQCGCGQSFQREVRTNKPKYLNDAHKMRAYRARLDQQSKVPIYFSGRQVCSRHGRLIYDGGCCLTCEDEKRLGRVLGWSQNAVIPRPAWVR